MSISIKESIYEKSEIPDGEAIIIGRAEYLGQEDRDIMEAVIIHGEPAARIARLMDVPPSQLRKRIHRLCRRLASREFLTAARLLQFLPEEERQLARRHFCEGLSQRDLAHCTGQSLHTVRRRLDRLRAKISTLSSMQPPAS
jgi:DNA-directed RNA polymerase specialized sigma24 family protein